MKIAFCLFKYFPYGGLQRDFLAIATAALLRGHEIHVYTLEWQGPIPKGFQVFLVPIRGITNHVRCEKFSAYLQKEFLNHSYDIVFGFNKLEGLDVYFAGDQCYVADSERWRRFFYRASSRHRYFLKAEGHVFSLVSHTEILALTKQQILEYRFHYGMPMEQFHLLLPKVTRDRLRPENWKEIRKEVRREFNIPENDFLLLLIGSGFRTKGLDRALHALHSLPLSLQEKTHFFVIGQDKSRSFINLGKRLGISKQLKFLSGRDDVPRFLFAADLLIHPAYSETTGTVLVEAIAAGLPLLITDVCGYAFHVEHAHAGIVIPSPFQQTVFNQALYELLTKRDRKQLSENALEYCKKHLLFDMPNNVVDLLEQKIYFNQKDPRSQLRAYLLDKRNFKKIIKMEGEVYRELEGRRTLRFEENGKGYFAKIHQGVGFREIFKNLIQGRWPVLGAINEYKAILRLNQLNIDTLSVVAFAQAGFNPATLKSFIVTDELSNTVSLEQYGKRWREQGISFLLKRAFIKKIALMARNLHANGLNHRDFYAAHLLVDISQGEEALSPENLKIYLIDLHRMQIRSKVPLRWVMKDIAALYFSVMDFGLTEKDLYRFIKLYQGKSLRRALKEDGYFWRRIIKQAIYLYYKAYHEKPELTSNLLTFARTTHY